MKTSVKTKKSRIAIFAGAGASAGLGLPTTTEFLKQIAETWTNIGTLISVYQKDRSEVEGKKTVDSEYIRDWLVNLKYAAGSIESISQKQPFETNISSTEYAVKFIDYLLTNFDLLVREAYGEVNPGRAYKHYAPFLEALYQRGISLVPVFTTNYDLVFESMQEYTKRVWHIETGMRSTGTRVVLDTNVFKKISPQRPKLLIFKLHGSTDWWTEESGNQVERITLSYTPPSNYRDLLIYPTREKFIQLKQAPFSFFYDKFSNYLTSRKLDLCIAIGYSFRDKFLNEIFVAAIKRGMRLLILDLNLKSAQLQQEFSPYGIDEALLNNNVRIERINFGNWTDATNLKKLEMSLDEEIGNKQEALSEDEV